MAAGNIQGFLGQVKQELMGVFRFFGLPQK
jgi:hypothetical protein